MRDDQTDFQDTVVIPFAWVPDGAAEPIDWLMCHPDALRVTATLKGTASSRPVIRDAAIGSAPAGTRLRDTGQTRDAELAAGNTWPVPCNPRRRPSAYWLTAAGARQHGPVAAYSRMAKSIGGARASYRAEPETLRAASPEPHSAAVESRIPTRCETTADPVP